MNEMVVISKDELITTINNVLMPLIIQLKNVNKLALPEKIDGDLACGRLLKKTAKAVQQMRIRGQLVEGVHYQKQGRAIIYNTHSLLPMIGD